MIKNDATNAARGYTGTITDELRTLNAALQSPDNLTALFGDDYDTSELTDETAVMDAYLNDYTLDVSVRIDSRGIDYGATIVIARTVGGPSCYIERDTNDGENVTVSTHWGSDSFTDRIAVERVAAWLDHLTESCA